jgi:Big-like domain-containing protein
VKDYDNHTRRNPCRSPNGGFKVWAGVCLLALCLSSRLAAAPSYSLDWDAIAGGGGVSTLGRYTLVDILGQPDAGIATNGTWRWEAGFLPGLNLQPAGNSATWVLNEDTPLIGTLTASDPEGDLLTFLLENPPAHGTVLLTNGTFTYKPATNFNGGDSFSFKVNDGEFDSASATATLTINPVNDPPTVAATPTTQTVQYSDAITDTAIMAGDVDSPGSSLLATTAWQKDGGSFTAGLPAGLALVLTNTTADSRIWILSGSAQMAPGTYLIRVTVRDDQAAGGTTDFIVVVTPEDARAVYTGALFASTASASSSLATVTLSATIQDITAVAGDSAYDSSGGDIRLSTVTFVNRDNNTIIATNVPVGLVNLSDPKTGTATYNWKVDIRTLNSQSFTVGIVVNGYYTRDSSDDDTVVTVSKPLASDFVTGGGYLLMLRSAGLCAGGSGTKANFGFNVKYNKSGKNLQGSINIIVRHAGRVYQVKGNVMSSLSILNNRATFNGKASIIDITDPLAPIAIDGNATLQVKMTDNGDPGLTDSIAITVWNKNGGLWFASNWSGTTTVEQTLAAGNLVVRSARALSLTELQSVATLDEALVLTIERLAVPQDEVARCGFVLRFAVVPETDYALERSADLLTWAHLTTVMSFTDAVEYFDEADSAVGAQFYRVRVGGGSISGAALFRIPQPQ